MSEVDEAIMRLNKGRNYSECSEAIESLGQLSDAKAVRQLVAVVEGRAGMGGFDEDEIESLREEAANALGELGSIAREAARPLMEILANKGEDSQLRAQAALSLGMIMGDTGDDAVRQALTRALIHDEDSEVRWMAIEAISGLATLASVPALIGAMSDSYDMVRAGACVVLGRLGDQRAEKPLRRALKDESDEVRYCAKEALADLARRGDR